MLPGPGRERLDNLYMSTPPSDDNLLKISYVYDILHYVHKYIHYQKQMSTTVHGGAKKNKVKKVVKNYTKSIRSIVWPPSSPKTNNNNKKYAGIKSKSRRIWTLAGNDFVKLKDIENDKFVFYKV